MEEILEEQQAYYRARAPEYDAWWQRTGRYDRGEQEAEEWQRSVAAAEDALRGFSPTGDVLELAGGTGWWTARLATTAERLTVVDSSAEVLDLNRARVGRPDIDYRQSDIFSWTPPRRYDTVFFSFWLSHVPENRFAEFWDLVGRCLAPGGRAFLIDSHDAKIADDVDVRQLSDGSRFRVVKIMYSPAELESALSGLGWTARIRADGLILYGSAVPG
ncbi:MAG TPA: class I SAM-dependent methyltransferase [Acidimicrobiales bacterium]|jgi:demethylmenaquinone methyltransferase/2-methoxy-6-polyprenyl-1,4-benzoquinol methylase|nr:class I SAM-dependent methyltransferase [Acidimicrobiales bacterium]